MDRVSRARAAVLPAIQAELASVTESAVMMVMASNTPNSGSAKSTPCVASTGIATAAANTTAPATQRGILGPSRSVLAACQVISPTAPALRMALRIFPAIAAAFTESAPKNGASRIG